MQPGGLVGLTLLPTSVTGGGSATGTLTLDYAAPPGGLIVTLSSSDTLARRPSRPRVRPRRRVHGRRSRSPPAACPPSPSPRSRPPERGVAVGDPDHPADPGDGADAEPDPGHHRRVVNGHRDDQRACPGGRPRPSRSPAARRPPPSPRPSSFPPVRTTATFTVTGASVGTASLSATLGGQTQTATLTVLSAPGTTYPAGLNLMSVPYDYTGTVSGCRVRLCRRPARRLAARRGAVRADAHAPCRRAAPRPGLLGESAPRAYPDLGRHAGRRDDRLLASRSQAGWNQIGDPFPISIKLSGLQAPPAAARPVPFAQAVTGRSPAPERPGLQLHSPPRQGAGGATSGHRRRTSSSPARATGCTPTKAVTLIVPHPAQ